MSAAEVKTSIVMTRLSYSEKSLMMSSRKKSKDRLKTDIVKRTEAGTC